MLRAFKSLGIAVGAALAINCPVSNAMTFGCDTPPDRFSAIAEEIEGDVRVSASIKADELRKGRFLPVAGFRVEGEDQKTRLSLRLVASSHQAKVFDIQVNFFKDGEQRDAVLGQVSTSALIPMHLALDTNGNATLNVGDQGYTVQTKASSKSTVQVLCSTGEFEFTDLHFGN